MYISSKVSRGNTQITILFGGRLRSSSSIKMYQLHDHINSADKFKNLLPREKKTLLETSNSVLKNYREQMKAGGLKSDCNVTYTIFFCGMTLACKKNIHFTISLVILHVHV